MVDPIELASWVAVAELQRRYGGMFQVLQTHPGGGQYDCLSLFTRNREHVADFNRRGRFHTWWKRNGNFASLDVWPRLVGNPGPADVIDEICELIGIPLPRTVPAPSPTTSACAFIAEFLRQADSSPAHWRAHNAYYDTSGYGGGERLPRDRFPGATQRLETLRRESPSSQPAYNFWLLDDGTRPRLCVATDGVVWREDEMEPAVQFASAAASDEDMPAIVQRAAGALLRRGASRPAV